VNKYKLLWSALEKIESGSISIKLPNGEIKKFDSNNVGPKAQINIKTITALDLSIHGGDVGFGESYMEEMWDSEDLPALLSFFTHNAESLEHYFHAKKWQSIWLFLITLFNKNSKRGSKKNISYHYDLGNNFYQLWLDKSMTYSSAIFDSKNLTLHKAQINKYNNILKKLSGQTVLEIGCGWGGFAIEAAKKKFDVTCLTLSKRQKQYFYNLIEGTGLDNNIKIKLQDYRDEKGIYDNIVSIEMFEAVGQKYWQKYFQTLNKCLKKKGKAVLQIITIDEEIFEDYRNRVDFIQKHIFPGGSLPTNTIIKNLALDNGMKVISELSFGLDYAKTLEIWLKNFDKAKSKIIEQGFDEKFIRKWRFYLSYCIAGFLAKRTDVVQFEIINE